MDSLDISVGYWCTCRRLYSPRSTFLLHLRVTVQWKYSAQQRAITKAPPKYHYIKSFFRLALLQIRYVLWRVVLRAEGNCGPWR